MIRVLLIIGFIAASLSASPIHPPITWVDSSGEINNQEVSYEKSCGACHDIEYIKSHDTHERLYTNPTFNCLTCHNQEIGQKEFTPESLIISRPRTGHCQQCHTNESIYSKKSGRVFSADKISQSDLNIAEKQNLNHPWDIHAERGVHCSDCHFSSNNPVYLRKESTKKQEHLIFDPRRPDIGEFLKKPNHQLAFQNNSRYDCTYCHTGEHSGIWQERSDIHFKKLACQSCHTPTLNAPVLKSINATIIDHSGNSLKAFHNVDSTGVISSFRPKLYKTTPESKFAPYNRVEEHYFYSTQSNSRVPDSIIAAITLEHQTEINSYLDTNKDKEISLQEKIPASGVYLDFVKIKLLEKGFEGVVVKSMWSFHAVAHNTVTGAYATKECTECHSSNNAFSTTYVPSEPTEILQSFECSEDALYIFGNKCTSTINLMGIFAILTVLVGILLHGGLRIILRLKNRNHHAIKTKKVYIYKLYERIWHWTQAIVILVLIMTGLVIHDPETFTLLGFEHAIYIHRALGIILGVNALFALFYNISTGKIRQFIPETKGFFGKVIMQQMFYLKGIFINAKHPFEKIPENRLNPLQQIAYLGLLNILLPMLIVTGFIIYFYPYDNALLMAIGGLETIAHIHTLCSWLMVSFLIMHIYLTTTGHKVTEYTKAMITGWEDVEDLTPTKNGTNKEHSNDAKTQD